MSLLFPYSLGHISRHESDDVRGGGCHITVGCGAVYSLDLHGHCCTLKMAAARHSFHPGSMQSSCAYCVPSGHLVTIQKRAILGAKFLRASKYCNCC
jgi:hypothetical protein